jgi:hypothetical protein
MTMAAMDWLKTWLSSKLSSARKKATPNRPRLGWLHSEIPMAKPLKQMVNYSPSQATRRAMPEETAITDLVADYLEIINSQDTDSQDDYVEAELAYALDELVSDYIELNGISIEEYSSIQEDVLNAIENDYSSDFDAEVSIDAGGNGLGDDGGLGALSATETSLPNIDIDTNITDVTVDIDYGDSGSP